MKLRTLGWTIAVIWAIGMTVAMARIAGTLESLAARSDVSRVPPAAPAGPSDVAITLRAAPPPPRPEHVESPQATGAPVEAEPPSPEQAAAQERAEGLLDQMIAQGSVDDESLDAMRQAILEMRPEDRIRAMGAFAAAASRGEIRVDPEDYRRILP